VRTWLLTPVILAAWSSAVFGAPADLSVGDVRVVEGNGGSRSVEVTVSISPAAPGPVTATYATRDGTATAGDFLAANGTVAFAPGEVVKKITVSIVGDTSIEADETFDLVLSNPSGATLADPAGTLLIVNDDFPARTPTAAGPSPGGLSVYEVRFTFVGSSGSLEGAPDCPVRSNGRVVLTGLVAGNEKVGPDDDIEYKGTLQLDADIDLCDARPAGAPDQFVLCALRVVGAGPLETELKVYFDDRGGYVQTSKPTGSFLKDVSGSCDAALTSAEETNFPDNSMANSFDGQELPLPSGPLQVGRYVDGALVVEVLRVVFRP
jgi:hypothetical protein